MSALSRKTAVLTLRKLLVIVAALIGLSGSCQAKDAFDSLHCGSDIPKALIGKVLGNEPVINIEKRHQDLALKNEGATAISDSLTYVAWTICGDSYHLLERGGIVRDALLVDHSRTRPAFLGTCEVDGSPTPYLVFAVLDTAAPADVAQHFSPRDSTLQAAVSAWRIDEGLSKFIRLDKEQLRCPRDGISSIDGGP
jgi:hypothetical protein